MSRLLETPDGTYRVYNCVHCEHCGAPHHNLVMHEYPWPAHTLKSRAYWTMCPKTARPTNVTTFIVENT